MYLTLAAQQLVERLEAAVAGDEDEREAAIDTTGELVAVLKASREQRRTPGELRDVALSQLGQILQAGELLHTYATRDEALWRGGEVSAEQLGRASESHARQTRDLAQAAAALDSMDGRRLERTPAAQLDVDALVGAVWQATQDAGHPTGVGDAAIDALRAVLRR